MDDATKEMALVKTITDTALALEIHPVEFCRIIGTLHMVALDTLPAFAPTTPTVQ